MILDSEDQRQMLLGLIAVSTLPGAAIEQAYALKAAISTAAIAPPASPAPRGAAAKVVAPASSSKEK